jgi:single-strand DNA-binding protein
MSVNKVILVGRLGKDPEIRHTSGGQSVANFSVATDETYKNRDGEKVKKTEWHRIVIWGKLAEIVESYLTKGSLVYLEGKIQSKEWEKDGVTRYDKEIVCDTMRMLGGNDREEAQVSRQSAPKRKNTKSSAPVEEEYEAEDEQIPF